jgi:peptide/nickel transport system permease protein
LSDLRKSASNNQKQMLPAHAPRYRSTWSRLLKSRRALTGLSIFIVLTCIAIFAPYIAPHSPIQADILNMFVPPSWEYPLGTDEAGRDVLSRLIYGTRTSLLVGTLAMSIAIILGTFIGGLSGYYGSLMDNLLMLGTDAMMSIPMYFLWITILTLIGPSFLNVLLVLGFTNWMRVARIVRGDTLKYREFDFVTASLAMGCPHYRILLWHMLPNVMPSVVVAASFEVARAIMAEAALSFLGLGVQPPTPSWGNMLMDAQTYIWNAPLLVMCIFITVAAFSLIGEGIRISLDPTLIGR